MKYAVAKGESDISELTTRIFEIKGKGAAATSKQVEAELLKANPHLSDLSKVKPGTLIVIPELVDAPKLRGPQVSGAGSDAIDHAKFAVEELAGAIDKLAKSAEEDIGAQLEALKDPELRKFAAESAEAKELLAKLTEALKARSKEIRSEAAAQKDGVKQLMESFGKLPV